MDVGYIRISIYEKNLTRQLKGVALKKKFKEKMSGRTIERPGLKKCLKWVREGDTLYIDSMDRLSRNFKDLHSIVKKMLQKGVVVKFYTENLTFDKSNPQLLAVMEAVAEFEKSIIVEIQQESIAATKTQKEIRGSGAGFCLSNENLDVAIEKIHKGIPKVRIAKKLGVSRQTLWAALKRRSKELSEQVSEIQI